MQGDDNLRNQRRETYASDYELAERVLCVARKIIHDLLAKDSDLLADPINKKKAYASLYTKLYGQYHSICSLCELGYSDSAMIILRSMLESYLVMHFLLKPKFLLYKKNNNPLMGELNENYRAGLYFANQIIQEEKMFKQWANIAGQEAMAKERLRRLEQDLANLEDNIGKPQMDYLRKHPGFFLGLSMEALANRVNQERLYGVVYRRLSQQVHAADADRNLIPDFESKVVTVKLGPDPEASVMPMTLASALFLLTIELINRRFALKYDSDIIKMLDQVNAALNEE